MDCLALKVELTTTGSQKSMDVQTEETMKVYVQEVMHDCKSWLDYLDQVRKEKGTQLIITFLMKDGAACLESWFRQAPDNDASHHALVRAFNTIMQLKEAWSGITSAAKSLQNGAVLAGLWAVVHNRASSMRARKENEHLIKSMENDTARHACIAVTAFKTHWKAGPGERDMLHRMIRDFAECHGMASTRFSGTLELIEAAVEAGQAREVKPRSFRPHHRFAAPDRGSNFRGWARVLFGHHARRSNPGGLLKCCHVRHPGWGCADSRQKHGHSRASPR